MLTVLLSLAIAPSTPDVEQLLSRMRTAYQHVRSVDFTTESHFGPTVYVNHFLLVRPNKIRLDITGKGTDTDFEHSLIKISDGKTILMKGPNTTKFEKMDFSIDNFSNLLPVNLESFSFWDADRQLSTAPGHNMAESALRILPKQSWNGRSWTVLEEHAPAQPITVLYYVDPKSNLIWRSVTTPDGQKEPYEDSQITSMKLGGKIDPDVFQAKAMKSP